MPRYRYKRASIISPKMQGRRVAVRSVSEGIALLRAIGEGELTLETREVLCGGHTESVRAVLPLAELLDRSREEIYELFDREADIARARRIMANWQARGERSWWKVPSDVRQLSPDGVRRLRHYAALIIAEIRIGNFPAHFTIEQSALADTRLLSFERRIADTYAASGVLADLLVLKPLDYSDLNSLGGNAGRKR